MEVSSINSNKKRRTDDSGGSSANNLNNGNGSHPACASCKHQRKKCTVDCILAPYFPADRNNEFLAVHMVFGVCNTIKLMRTVDQERRQKVADSLIWEALCRQRDPILGSLGEYRKLQEELEVYKRLINNSNGQLIQQRTVMCGPSPGMLAWKGTNVPNGLNISTGIPNRAGQISNNIVTQNQTNENGNVNTLVNPVQFTVPSPYMLGQSIEKTKQDNGNNIINSVNLQQNFTPKQQRQNLLNGYCQQHYISGQFNSINGNTDHTSLCTDVLAPF